MNERIAPSPSLRAHGSDCVEVRSDGSIVLTAAAGKGWRVRSHGTRTSAEHPGTAVRWDGAIFEVLEVEPLASGKARYRLAAWDSRHAIRTIESYDEATEGSRAAERRERAANVRRRRPLSLLLSPILGHLPGPVQQKMEWDFGAPARVMTIVSALPLLVLGFAGLIAWFAQSAGAAPFLPWLADRPVLCLYLSVESVLRLGYAFLAGEPIGSLAGTVVWELWRRARGMPSPPEWKPLPATADRAAVDRFRMLEPILALLSEEEQERLEERFGFDTIRWGRFTSFVLLAISGANVAASLIALAAGVVRPADVLWLLAGGGILFEQVLRLRRLSRNPAAGSVLGGLVRPLASSLLS